MKQLKSSLAPPVPTISPLHAPVIESKEAITERYRKETSALSTVTYMNGRQTVGKVDVLEVKRKTGFMIKQSKLLGS